MNRLTSNTVGYVYCVDSLNVMFLSNDFTRALRNDATVTALSKCQLKRSKLKSRCAITISLAGQVRPPSAGLWRQGPTCSCIETYALREAMVGPPCCPSKMNLSIELLVQRWRTAAEGHDLTLWRLRVQVLTLTCSEMRTNLQRRLWGRDHD